VTSASLYQSIVLEHNRAPRNFGRLDDPTHAADGANPMCGDALHVELVAHDGKIEALRFSGESCAITTAAASMLSELVADADALDALRARFEAMLRADPDAPEDPALGALNALSELRRYPARWKCALLPFATLGAALRGSGKATTEAP
jgi:nitrogen fixation NifU-like protein